MVFKRNRRHDVCVVVKAGVRLIAAECIRLEMRGWQNAGRRGSSWYMRKALIKLSPWSSSPPSRYHSAR